jgi:hypothetical protein
MSSVALQGNASGIGAFVIASPNSSSNRTLTLPDQTGTILTGSGAISVNASSPNSSLGIDAQGYLTNPVNGNGIGRVQAFQYYRLNSDLAGANVSTAQSIFGVGVTLVGSMVYEFEIYAAFTKSAGVTSHAFQAGFGGTATVNNIGYSAFGQYNAATIPSVVQTQNYGFVSNTITATQLVGGISTAGVFVGMLLKGTVSINAGGTFIPQYTLSSAPGGAYSTIAGSYVKIAAIGVSASNNSIGSWA